MNEKKSIVEERKELGCEECGDDVTVSITDGVSPLLDSRGYWG